MPSRIVTAVHIKDGSRGPDELPSPVTTPTRGQSHGGTGPTTPSRFFSLRRLHSIGRSRSTTETLSSSDSTETGSPTKIEFKRTRSLGQAAAEAVSLPKLAYNAHNSLSKYASRSSTKRARQSTKCTTDDPHCGEKVSQVMEKIVVDALTAPVAEATTEDVPTEQISEKGSLGSQRRRRSSLLPARLASPNAEPKSSDEEQEDRDALHDDPDYCTVCRTHFSPATTDSASGDPGSDLDAQSRRWRRRHNMSMQHNWNFVKDFVDMSFDCPSKEAQYQTLDWLKTKKLAMWAAIFLVYCWIMLVATVPRPFQTEDYYIYYLLLTVVTTPLPILIWCNVPARYPWIWQAIALISAWSYPIAQLMSMKICDFYGPNRHCGTKDFQSIFFYSSSAPVLSLFCFRQKRALVLIGTALYAILACALIVPQRGSWGRNVSNVTIYTFFVTVLHGIYERNDRSMFTIQRKLAQQVKKTEEAKQKEQMSHDSKRRFQNFIFHEVRVPLNVALLAFENLDAHGCFEKPGLEFEYTALKNSHGMMSKVLDDVLDLDRMELGTFSKVVRPFVFHSVISDIAANLKMSTRAKELNLEVKLDSRIDEVAKSLAESSEGAAPGDGPAVMMGDATRLQQIIQNLCSNATKFTSKGGNISLTTQLIHPLPSAGSPTISDAYRSLSNSSFLSSRVDSTESAYSSLASDVIVVRIEIADSGCGIKPEDLDNDRLFSPYVQTVEGQMQGGKGTGLGLSLVRHIVGLSGGRLGVRSRPGHGSTFFIDMPYSVTSTSAACAGTGSTLSKHDAVPSEPIAALAQPGKSQLANLRSPLRPRTAPTPYQKRLGFAEAVNNHRSQMSLPGIPSRSPSPQDGQSASEAVPSEAGAKPSNIDTDGPLTVLIVDDDPITRRVVSRMLSRLGAITIEAENGKIALEILHGKTPKGTHHLPDRFDLCFLDNQMPIMSGIACIKALRASDAPCRSQLVCAVTGNATLHDQQEFLDAGANYILTKPTGEAALKGMLALAKEQREARAKRLEMLRDAAEQISPDQAVR